MSLEVVRAGLLDTLQDGGRYGYQHVGINPTGAMDSAAMKMTNALLGNELETGVIEMCFPAPIFKFNTSATIALTGANFEATINGVVVPINHAIEVPTLAELKFSKNRGGVFCYLAVQKGFDADSWLGSISTNIKAKAGGWKGRVLQKGDQLPFRNQNFKTSQIRVFPWSVSTDFYSNPSTIHCTSGPEFDWLDKSSKEKFEFNSFKLIPLSDRMGYRFESESLKKINHEELLSTAASFGTIQLLPSGQIICLMADHQTTGGYPRIAQVIQADLPKLAQRRPNESVTFKFVSLVKAEDLLVAQTQLIKQIQSACKLKIDQLVR